MNNKLKKLNKYLVEKGLYQQFYYNFNHTTYGLSVSERWKRLHHKIFTDDNPNYHISEYIMYGFEWETTPEGAGFWCTLCNELCHYSHKDWITVSMK